MEKRKTRDQKQEMSWKECSLSDKSFLDPSKLAEKLQHVLQAIRLDENACPFNQPVEEMFTPDYYTVVKEPMDLCIINNKVENKEYLTKEEFVKDFKRMVDNCAFYNGLESEMTSRAYTLWTILQRTLRKVFRIRSNVEVSLYIPKSYRSKMRKMKQEETAMPSDGKKKKNGKVPKKIPNKGLQALEALALATKEALQVTSTMTFDECCNLENMKGSCSDINDLFPGLKTYVTQNHPPSFLAKHSVSHYERLSDQITAAGKSQEVVNESMNISQSSEEEDNRISSHHPLSDSGVRKQMDSYISEMCRQSSSKGEDRSTVVTENSESGLSENESHASHDFDVNPPSNMSSSSGYSSEDLLMVSPVNKKSNSIFNSNLTSDKTSSMERLQEKEIVLNSNTNSGQAKESEDCSKQTEANEELDSCSRIIADHQGLMLSRSNNMSPELPPQSLPYSLGVQERLNLTCQDNQRTTDDGHNQLRQESSSPHFSLSSRCSIEDESEEIHRNIIPSLFSSSEQQSAFEKNEVNSYNSGSTSFQVPDSRRYPVFSGVDQYKEGVDGWSFLNREFSESVQVTQNDSSSSTLFPNRNSPVTSGNNPLRRMSRLVSDFPYPMDHPTQSNNTDGSDGQMGYMETTSQASGFYKPSIASSASSTVPSSTPSISASELYQKTYSTQRPPSFENAAEEYRYFPRHPNTSAVIETGPHMSHVQQASVFNPVLRPHPHPQETWQRDYTPTAVSSWNQPKPYTYPSSPMSSVMMVPSVHNTYPSNQLPGMRGYRDSWNNSVFDMRYPGDVASRPVSYPWMTGSKNMGMDVETLNMKAPSEDSMYRFNMPGPESMYAPVRNAIFIPHPQADNRRLMAPEPSGPENQYSFQQPRDVPYSRSVIS